MKKIFLILTLAFISSLITAKDLKINHSIYDTLSDPDKDRYLNSLQSDGEFQSYFQRYPYGTLDIYYEKEYNPRYASQKIFLIIDKTYYEDSDFVQLFDRFALDLAYQGFASSIYVMNSGNPKDLRNFIIANSTNLKGVVFIGDLSVAWYEHENDFNWHVHAEWPSDLFYGDLNGTYSDSDGDGIYDVFSGDTAPEIWTSRISLGQIEDRMYWTDESFTRKTQTINLFNNIHNYFRGTLKYGNRAGNVITEDFDKDTNGLNRFDSVYGKNVDLYIDGNFNTIRYADAMSDVRNEAIYLDAHSQAYFHLILNPFYSSSLLNNVTGSDTIDLYPFTINQMFFGLGACSSCQFTYLDNESAVGNSYLFAKYTKAQTIYGMTKTSNNERNYILFDYAGKGEYIADAFVKWYRDNWNSNKLYTPSYPEYWMSWNGGEIILGNPLIKLNRSLPYYTPNAPPVLSINNKTYTVREGTELRISLPSKDYDGDILLYALNTQLPNASISGNAFVWTPNYTQGGITYNISIIANDGYEEADNHLIITVQNVKRITK